MRYVIVLILFSNCTYKSTNSNFFKIANVEVLPCEQFQNYYNHFFFPKRVFSERKNVYFAFFISGLLFVNEHGIIGDQNIPAAGQNGIFDTIRSINVIIPKEKFEFDITDSIEFISSKRQNIQIYTENNMNRSVLRTVIANQIHFKGVNLFDNFSKLIRTVNGRGRGVTGRDLVNYGTRPFILFKIPESFIRNGNNTLIIRVFCGDHEVAEGNVTYMVNIRENMPSYP